MKNKTFISQTIGTGTPQGYVLSPLLFFTNNYTPGDLSCNIPEVCRWNTLIGMGMCLDTDRRLNSWPSAVVIQSRIECAQNTKDTKSIFLINYSNVLSKYYDFKGPIL